ncbi:MAG: hypothetical protein LQ349_004416, partial [Xanthoria aureola]
MGICSKVEDVTPTNRTICRLENDGIGGTLTNCGYTVQELQKHPDEILYPVPNGKKLTYTLWIGSNDEYPNPNTLVEFYAIYLSNTSTPSSDIQEGTSDTVVALKGSLNLCVLSYQTQMRNGITETVEISRKDNLTWQTKSKNVCHGGSSSCPVIASSDGGTECWMESVDRKAFNQYLGLEIFRGYTTVGLDLVSSDETGLIDTAASIAGMVVNKTVSEGQDKLAKWLNNLAQAMTNSLRETAVQKDKARGVAAVPEIHIAVQFRWLAGPIASVILSFIFLLAVIFQTSHRGVPPWKMSSIAGLLSLDHETAQLIASQDHGTSLKSRAKALRVRLCQGDDQGWRLRGKEFYCPTAPYNNPDGMQVDDIIYSVYYDRIQSLAVRLANDLVEKDRYLTTTTLSLFFLPETLLHQATQPLPGSTYLANQNPLSYIELKLGHLRSWVQKIKRYSMGSRYTNFSIDAFMNAKADLNA